MIEMNSICKHTNFSRKISKVPKYWFVRRTGESLGHVDRSLKAHDGRNRTTIRTPFKSDDRVE